MSRLLRFVSSGFCLLAALLVAAGSAQAAGSGVDRAFGVEGVVHVEPFPALNGGVTHVVDLAAAPGGASYALESEFDRCEPEGCLSNLFLVRYDQEGNLDPEFNRRSGALVAEDVAAYPANLIADGRGRPIVALSSGSGYRLYRFGLDGSSDPSFGGDGIANVRCQCSGSPSLVLDRRGRILVEAGGSYEAPSTVFLARLRPDGALDRSFGRGGNMEVSFDLGAPGGFAARPGGAVYLFGRGCCDGSKTFYLIRVSRRGKLDTRFNVRARRSLERLRKKLPRRGASFSDQTLVLRSHGRLDLFAQWFGEDSYVLRLRSSGNPDLGFGHRGTRKLALPVESAALDNRGGTFVIGSDGHSGGMRIEHLLSGGRVDPSFGAAGSLPLPSRGEEGDVVAAQRGGRAIVLDVGDHVCRGSCPQTPTLLRFIARHRGARR